MRKFSALLFCFLVGVSSYSQESSRKKSSDNKKSESHAPICKEDLTPLGGGTDVMPWAVAKPFPWTSIQGTWITTSKDLSHLVFKFKVIRSDESVKQLAVQVIDTKNCKNTHKGIGLISTAEKNVIRVFMNNILLKMAVFNTVDLGLGNNNADCSQKLLGATLFKVDADENGSDPDPESTYKTGSATSMLLKKITQNEDYKCKPK